MTDKIDPAEEVREKQDEERVLSEMKTFDLKDLTTADFKVIPMRQARMIHPFDGYPLKPKIEIGRKKNNQKVTVSATFIVGLAPTAEPAQDVSGMGVTIIEDKTKKEKIVNLKTYHSRVVQTGPHSNDDVVFDRVFNLADGAIMHYAVVNNHSTRAQLLFRYDSKNKRIEVDKRYSLLDDDQNSRLRQLYTQIINPKLRRERMADQVSGEVEATEESLQQLPTG